MSDQRNGGIAWTDETWNPIRGCSKVSQGCKNCYAETMGARFSGAGQPYADVITNGRWNGKVVMVPEHLADPLRWKRPRRVFVNSMSDLFHESLTNEQIAAVFGVMAAAPRHTFQVLTKRPERAREWFGWVRCQLTDLPSVAVGRCVRASRAAGAAAQIVSSAWPLPNVWLGVSVEDQKTADERIPLLLQCPAAVRWVSAEPLLGPVNLTDIKTGPGGVEHWDALDAIEANDAAAEGECSAAIDWLVVGGESGPGARPMHPDWARSLRDQCKAAGVPFLFKQWGDWIDVGDAHELAERGVRASDNERCVNLTGGHGFHGPSPRRMRRAGKKAAGRLLDGVLHDEYPSPTDACLMKADRLRAEVTAS